VLVLVTAAAGVVSLSFMAFFLIVWGPRLLLAGCDLSRKGLRGPVVLWASLLLL
jgi:hypothetical protein